MPINGYKWIKKVLCLHTMEYYAALKKKEISIYDNMNEPGGYYGKPSIGKNTALKTQRGEWWLSRAGCEWKGRVLGNGQKGSIMQGECILELIVHLHFMKRVGLI